LTISVETPPWIQKQVSSISHLHAPKTISTISSERNLPTYPIISSLRQSQYPFALEHYRLRFNKTKRRRPKIPQSIPNAPPPLDTKGWSVRTNFKLAAYSEYRQEFDVAIKFYDIAYNELMDLFSSTAILPPRTKRWSDARILSDSIAYKVSPLFV
jgi:hypothetical protein